MGFAELPEPETAEVEIDLSDEELPALLDKAERDELAPIRPQALLRYLIYLGAGYLEAERIVEQSSDCREGFERLHRLYGAVGGRVAVLRFHYSEAARGFAEEERAHPAHERMAGAYEALVEIMEREIETRESRIRNLEEAVGDEGLAADR